MKTSYSLAILLSGAFALGLLAGNTATLQDSLAQGYGGLIPAETKKKTTGKPDEPLGYQGLIPGATPGNGGEEAPAAAQNDNPAPPIDYGYTPIPPTAYVAKGPITRSAPPAMTPVRSRAPARKVETVDDIKLLAATSADRVDWKNAEIPPGLMDNMRALFKPEARKRLARPSMRINGMLMKEYSTKEKIDRLMLAVNNPGYTKEQRRAAAKKAREKLESHAEYLNIMSEFPDDIYRKLDMPDLYVKETQEAEQKSLARVRAAILVLQKFE